MERSTPLQQQQQKKGGSAMAQSVSMVNLKLTREDQFMLVHNEQTGTLAYEPLKPVAKQTARQRQPQQRRKSVEAADPFEIVAAMEVSRDKVRLANNRQQQQRSASTINVSTLKPSEPSHRGKQSAQSVSRSQMIQRAQQRQQQPQLVFNPSVTMKRHEIEAIQIPQQYLNLLSSPRHTFSDSERERLRETVFQGIPPQTRGLFWQKCSGVNTYKQDYCPDYYLMLKHIDQNGNTMEYPNRQFKQIDKDMDRTFPGDPFYDRDVKDSIRAICRAYVWRNPLVGYSQGMNYLIFRLRKHLSEEDTFWLFCMIVETYLPPDFYADLFGARVHFKLLMQVLLKFNFLPDVIKKLNELDYPISNLVCQFYLSLFTSCLPEAVSLQVLDLFLLEGADRVIYDVTIAYLSLMEKQILSCTNITKVIDPQNPIFENQVQVLMTEVRKVRLQLKQSQIDQIKAAHYRQAYESVQAEVSQKLQVDKRTSRGVSQQKQFLRKFKMFQGVESLMIIEANRAPYDFFQCSAQWPICAFNHLKEHTVPEFLVYKVESFSKVEILKDYFLTDATTVSKKKLPKAIEPGSLLIGRQQHYCLLRDFKEAIATMFSCEDPRLLQCEELHVTKKLSQQAAHKRMMKFCQHVIKCHRQHQLLL